LSKPNLPSPIISFDANGNYVNDPVCSVYVNGIGGDNEMVSTSVTIEQPRELSDYEQAAVSL
jgi:hypothetical protein